MARTLSASVLLDTKQATSALKNLEQQGKASANNIAVGFMKGKVALDAIYAAGNKAFGFLKSSVADAALADAAFNKLTTSMKTNGMYTKALSTEYQKFANTIQSTTAIEGDAVLSLMGKIGDLSRLGGKDLEKLTTVTLSFAQMFKKEGQDTVAAADKASKSLSIMAKTGDWSGLESKLGLAKDSVKNLDDAVQATAAGMNQAKAEIDTYAGGMTQLNNIWGDFKEQLGGYITQSPAVIESIKLSGTVISDLTTYLMDGTREQGSFFDQMLIGMGVTKDSATEFDGLNTILSNTLDYMKEHPKEIGEAIEKVGEAAKIAEVAVAIFIGVNGLTWLINSARAIATGCTAIAGGIAGIGTAAKIATAGAWGLVAALAAVAIANTYAVTHTPTEAYFGKDIYSQTHHADTYNEALTGMLSPNYNPNGFGMGTVFTGDTTIKHDTNDDINKIIRASQKNIPKGGGGSGGGGSKKEEYQYGWKDLIDTSGLEDAGRYLHGEHISYTQLIDDQKELEKRQKNLNALKSQAEANGADKKTLQALKGQLTTIDNIAKAIDDYVNPALELEKKNTEQIKTNLEDQLSWYKKIGETLEKQINIEDKKQDAYTRQIGLIKELMQALDPGSVSIGADALIKKFQDAGVALESSISEGLQAWAKYHQQNGPVTEEDMFAYLKSQGVNANQLQTPLTNAMQALKDSREREKTLIPLQTKNNELITDLNDKIDILDGTMNWVPGAIGQAIKGAAITKQVDKSINAAQGATLPAGTPPTWDNTQTFSIPRAQTTPTSTGGHYEDVPYGCETGACSYRKTWIPDNTSSKSNIPTGPSTAFERQQQEKAQEEQEAAQKKAEDEAKKAAEEAKRRQQAMMAPWISLINSGIGNIGNQGGFGQGIKSGIPALGSSLVGSLVPEPFGGLLGNLAGKLLGGIFGKKKEATRVEPTPVYVVNTSDIANALLNVTKQMFIGGSSGGINRLENLRLKQNAMGR